MNTGDTDTVVAQHSWATTADSGTGVRAALSDGQIVVVRALTAEDQDAVLRLHQTLGERDRYFRFFGPLPARVADLVLGMCAPSDARHGSMGAFTGGELIGVAHYEVLADPTRAEVALAVSGTSQTHGVGTLLLEHLTSVARRRGVRRFVAQVLTENTRMLRVLRDCGLPCRIRYDGGVTDVALTLDEVEPYLDAMAERERVADVASLAAVLRPTSVVVIGAGRHPGSIGHAVLRNILAGGFAGQVFAVNPHTDRILNVPAFATVAQLPGTPELAVVCVPAHAVPDIARQCGRAGVRALLVISGGVTADEHHHAELLAAVREFGMRLVGPNCVGVSNSAPGIALDATFAPSPAPGGSIGLVTQSGGIAIALRERLGQLGLGLSTMVSTGDKYDISGNDLLMWWQHDQQTAAAVLYLESFGNPRKFARLARALANRKPVLALRTGNNPAAQRAAASHTAAAATPAVTRDALFRQAGIIGVDTAADLIGTLAALSWQPLPRGNRVAIVTNAGGAGVLAADACAEAGITLADLSPATVSVLTGLLPEQASSGNPVDTTAAVDPDTFARCVAAVCADSGVDAVLAATVRTAVGDPSVRLTSVDTTGTPLLAARLGQAATVSPLLSPAGIPVTASYADPADAIQVIGRLAEYARWRAMPVSPVPAIDVDVPGALGILREQFRATPGGGWLDPARTARLLRCFDIPLVDSKVAGDAGLAAAMFDELGGGPVVVKAIAEGLLHKTARGGVLLDLRDRTAVEHAVATLAERFGADLRGVQVQPMVAAGRELLVGVHSDGTFGPLVVFGLGGVDTDMLADRAARLGPLTEHDADELLRGLRGSAALFGPGAAPALDVAAVRDVLLRVSLLADVLPEVVELDLNPLIVASQGCLVVDARIRTAPVATADPFLPQLRG